MIRRRNDDLEQTPAKRRDDIYLRLSDRVPFVGGSELSISGKHLAVVVVAVAALILALVLGFIHDSRAEDRGKLVMTALQAQQEEMKAGRQAIAQLAEAINTNTYVLAMPEPKRQLLDLAEPKAIRELREYREWQRRQR